MDKLRNAKRDGMPIGERQRLRNQISAQRSRLKKKEENLFLNKKVREKDKKFECFIASLGGIVTESQAKAIWERVRPEWERIDQVENEVGDAVLTPSGVKVPKKRGRPKTVNKKAQEQTPDRKPPISPKGQLKSLNPDREEGSPFQAHNKKGVPQPFGGVLPFAEFKSSLFSSFLTPEEQFEHFR